MFGRYILRRFYHMVIILLIISIFSFIIIELPPGDYLTFLGQQLAQENMSKDQMEGYLKVVNIRFGLDRPLHIRYLKWMSGIILEGDFGYSLTYRDNINKLIGQKTALTMLIFFGTLILTMATAIPIGVYSSTHQYSAGDYGFTFLGFIGLATPNFLLALIILFIAVTVFGASGIGGLFSSEYILEPWSLAKVWDLLNHLWLPVIIVGTAGTAATIRVVRARMLDVLGEPYIQTARMKGISEGRVVTKHALRVAINPVITSLGLSFPQIISGATLVAIVLALPTLGPFLINALIAQDMYLGGAMLLVMTSLLVVGNFVADLALSWVDPRIRYG